MRVDGADKTGVERARDMPDLDRVARIGNRDPDERLLDRAADPRAVTRTDIPGGRGDDLVVLDLAAFDIDPVAERAARRLGRAPAAAVTLDRLDVPEVVKAEFAQRALGLAVKPDDSNLVCFSAAPTVARRREAQAIKTPGSASSTPVSPAASVPPPTQVIAGLLDDSNVLERWRLANTVIANFMR